jgi:hypothetical protein
VSLIICELNDKEGREEVTVSFIEGQTGNVVQDDEKVCAPDDCIVIVVNVTG